MFKFNPQFKSPSPPESDRLLAWFKSADFDLLLNVLQSRATKAMSDFATEHGRSPGEFLSTNQLTNGQAAALREHAYITCAIRVLDDLKTDILDRLTRDETPFPIVAGVAVDWVPEATTPAPAVHDPLSPISQNP